MVGIVSIGGTCKYNQKTINQSGVISSSTNNQEENTWKIKKNQVYLIENCMNKR